MNLTLVDLLAVFAGNAGVLWLGSKWLEARLQASIQHEYDKKMEAIRHEYERQMEDYRNSIRIREQAARVVDLLVHAHHAKAPDPEKFNRLAWELSLWLPADLIRELTRLLCSDPGAKHPKEILVAVRRILLQDPNDPLEPAEIVHQPEQQHMPLAPQPGAWGTSGT
jgi:hypothetical protein